MATEKAAMEEFKSLFQQELDRGHGKTGDGEHAANDSEEDTDDADTRATSR